MVVSFVKVDLSSLSVYSTSGDDEVISLRIIHPTSRQARKLSKFPSLDSNLHFPTISDITWVPALSLSLADMMSNKTWATRTKRIASGLYATPTLLCFENKNQRMWLAEQYLSTNRGPIRAAENHLSNSRQLKQNKGCEVVKDRAKWSIASSQGYPRRSWRRYSGT